MPKETGSSSGGVLGLSEITENHSIWKMLIAECLGTLILVFICCGSCIGINQSPDYVPYVQIALTFGFTVASIAQAIGHISGCHINPAVTVSFLCTGNIKLVKAVLYIVVQCVGAIGGAALLRLVTPNEKVGSLGLTIVSPQLTAGQGLLVEAILTFLLVFVVHGVCDSNRKDIAGSIPVAIGLAVSAAHLCGIQYTGSSINPARTFGPAVIMNSWEYHWVYWVGPLLGGVVAGILYRTLFRVRKGESDGYDF
ncbi:aquaporin AQPAe.a [Leptinotarsa decemlineata]|uniref:aquaporin AQPAe.a n=1 Tax=Leptinotarsa decemlineata TaxID=7539 RepID=UPI000C25372D|nr:aquaporin AQPAe.a-like [Leptinotarsa decemlineata]